MLDGVANAYRVECPGELFRLGDGGTLAVYPAGLVHLRTHIEAFAAAAVVVLDSHASPDVVAREKVVAEAAKAMLGPGFPLLSICCVPPLSSSEHPAAATAAASWAEQTLADLIDDPPEPEPAGGDEGNSRSTSLEAVLTGLLSVGHTRAQIFRDVQQGSDDRPLPYAGWTLPQWWYWGRGVRRLTGRNQARAVDAVSMAICGTWGGEKGSRAMDEYTDAMREE